MAGNIPHLGRLPAELTSLVANELDAASFGILRLVSKPINAIFTPWFLRHVKTSQTIEFTLDGITRLRSLSLSALLKSIVSTVHFVVPYHHVTPAKVGAGTTSPGDLYPRRRDNVSLKLIEFLKTPDDRSWLDQKILEQARVNEDIPATIALLTEIFRNFKALGRIILEATVVLGPEYQWPPEQVDNLDWRPMWAGNIDAFRTVVQSIAESQIELKALEVFKNTDLCSIPINELAITQTEDFQKVASRLRHFSISLSSAVREPFSSETQALPDPDLSRLHRNTAITRSEDVGIGHVTRLLESMVHLKALNIHFYQTCWFNEGPTPFVDMLERAFQSVHFIHLTHLSLLCVPVTPTTIDTILTCCPQLQSLSLRLLQLDQDSWVQALMPLGTSPVKLAYLSNLFFSDYSLGFRVLQNRMMRDIDMLCERHPNIKRIISSRDGSSKAESGVPRLEEEDHSLLLEIDPEVIGNGGFQSGKSMQLMRVRQRLCGPPCRQGQYLFGGNT